MEGYNERMTQLDEVIGLFRSFKSGVITMMQKLHQVKESGVWQERFSSWGEFVEAPEGLGISQGFASKLLSVNRHYLLEANLSPEKLQGVDYESLYLAAKTEGTPEEQVEKARLLTRTELKQTKAEQTPHEPAYDTYCSHCWLSQSNHP